jgi:16S rRNA (guanine1207-N2)-methyltransferase
VRSISVFHRNFATLQSLRAALRSKSNITIFDAPFPPEEGRKFDLGLVQVPKGRGYSRALLYTTLRSLRVGAPIFVAGSNTGGANTALSDLETLSKQSVPTLATKARHRIFSVACPAELETPAEWEAPWEARRHSFTILDQTYELYTQPGVFSHDHLDPGTSLLIETLIPHLKEFPKDAQILDAACGYGILGMAMQRELSTSRVGFADVDLLALGCLKQSLPSAMIVPADLSQSPVLPQAPFDLILCNPPFHQEHAKDLSFMHGFAPHARRVLSGSGKFALVANSFLPYRDLLRPHFGSVETLICTPVYQVLLCGG